MLNYVSQITETANNIGLNIGDELVGAIVLVSRQNSNH